MTEATDLAGVFTFSVRMKSGTMMRNEEMAFTIQITS